MKTFVIATALVAASVAVVPAQGAPAVQPVQPAAAQPAQPGAAQPAAPGAAAPAPAAEPFTYDPAGRRDPFVSLLSRGMEPVTGKKPTGLASPATAEGILRGVMQSRNAYVALVAGADGKTHSPQVNRRLPVGILGTVT